MVKHAHYAFIVSDFDDFFIYLLEALLSELHKAVLNKSEAAPLLKQSVNALGGFVLELDWIVIFLDNQDTLFKIVEQTFITLEEHLHVQI